MRTRPYVLFKPALVGKGGTLNHTDDLETLTLKEAAQLTKIKASRLRTAIFRREVPYLKIGGLIRFRKDDLRNWLGSSLVMPEEYGEKKKAN